MDHYDIPDMTIADSYSLDDWLAELSCLESNMDYWKIDAWEEQTYGRIWDDADRFEEEKAIAEGYTDVYAPW